MHKIALTYFYLLRLGKLYACAAAMLMAGRLALHFSYGMDLTAHEPVTDILYGYWLGLRYDGVTLVPLFGVPLLSLYAWIGWNASSIRIWVRLTQIWCSAVFALLAFLIIADLVFFASFDDHLNSIALKIFTEDIDALWATARAIYPMPALLGATFCIVLFSTILVFRVLSPPPESEPHSGHNKWLLLTGLVALVLAAVLIGRGAIGAFPLRMQHAAYSENAFLNVLGPNGIYSLQKALKHFRKGHPALHYWKKSSFGTDLGAAMAQTRKEVLNRSELEPIPAHTPQKELLDYTLASLQGTVPPHAGLQHQPPHVVLIVVESLGAWPLALHSPSFQIAPGFKAAAKSAVHFTRFFSNGVRTIGSLDALMLSTPSIGHITSVSETELGHVSYPSAIAKVFSDNGYTSSFVYSGKLSRYRMDRFLPLQGFSTLYGQATYGDQESTTWGVHDHVIYEYIESKLNSAEAPQFITALTTTNHPPFELPDNYENALLSIPNKLEQSLKGDLKQSLGRFRTFQYSIDQLARFVTRVQASPAGRNTIILAVGDHNFEAVKSWPTEELADSIRVPMLLWIPEKFGVTPGVSAKIGSHVDIAPTLYHLALSNASYISMGRNLLDPTTIDFAHQQLGYTLTKDCVMLKPENGGVTRYFSWAEDQLTLQSTDQSSLGCSGLSQKLDAYLSTASVYLERYSSSHGKE